MLDVLLTGSIAFVITCLAIPAIMRVADEKKLFDLPDARKLHTRPIASLGGVGIFIGFLLSILLTTPSSNELQYFFAAALVIFFLGLKDDILIISARKKFLGQLAAAAIIIHLGHIRIDSMHGMFGIDKLPEAVSLLLTYSTVIVVVNAYNLIDGVDGLAGGLGLVTTLVFGSYFYLAHMPVYAALAFSMSGALLAFLVFNFHPARIFMGDSGSLMLGMVNSILVIKFITVADYRSAILPLDSSVGLGAAILFVPLLDTLRVFSIRISNGRSPFSPDRKHIHHLLLDRGLNHKQTSLTCIGLNIAFVAMAYFGRSLGSTVLIASMSATFFTLVWAITYFRKPVSKLVVATTFQHLEEPVIQANSTKVVPIKNESIVAEQ